MTRHELREQTFRMLFGICFHEAETPEEALENYIEVSLEGPATEAEKKEMTEKVIAVYQKRQELDAKIDRVAEGWNTKRMGKAELNILRLALFEMLYDQCVPMKVAINEAVELAKEYGDGEAHSFVNGILARLVDSVPQPEEAAQEENI